MTSIAFCFVAGSATSTVFCILGALAFCSLIYLAIVLITKPLDYCGPLCVYCRQREAVTQCHGDQLCGECAENYMMLYR